MNCIIQSGVNTSAQMLPLVHWLFTFYSLLALICQFLDHLSEREQATIDIATLFEACACDIERNRLS